MKFRIAAVASAAVFAMFSAASASAQDFKPEYYGNLGYSIVNDDSDLNLGAIHGRLGARLNRYFGVEGEAAFGVKSDTEVVSGVAVEGKLSHDLAAYVVGFLPLTPQVDLFVRGGYGDVRVRASAGAVSASASEGSWNYGGGGQYMFDGKNGLRAEYTRFDLRHNAGSADVWSLSFVRKF